MANASKAVDSARKAFSKRGGMLRTVDALRLGIHPRTLYKLRDRGELERVGRGLYRLSSAPHLTNPDWVTVAIRAPTCSSVPDIRASSSWYDNTGSPHH